MNASGFGLKLSANDLELRFYKELAAASYFEIIFKSEKLYSLK